VENCSSTCRNFYFEKHQNLDFGGISKFCLWADFGNFGQFSADFVAFTVVESMPEFGLKS
jgi:hypothetical protein